MTYIVPGKAVGDDATRPDCYYCGGPAPVKHDDLCAACYGSEKVRNLVRNFDCTLGNDAFVRQLADLVTDLQRILADLSTVPA